MRLPQADIISSTARSAVRFCSSMTGFTSTTSIECSAPTASPMVSHRQVRFAVGHAGHAAFDGRADTARLLRIDGIMSNDKWNRDSDRLLDR